MWRRRGSTRVGGGTLLLRFIGLLVLVAGLGEFGVQRAIPVSQGTVRNIKEHSREIC